MYFGSRAYGVQAAAQTYFGKNVGQVNLAEAALLAGLPQRPSKLNPYENPEAAKLRRDIVLRRMLELGMAKPADVEKAWGYAMSSGRVNRGRVIVEEMIHFDYEITLLAVAWAMPLVARSIMSATMIPLGFLTLAALFAMTMSCRPSPLKSPRAALNGILPLGRYATPSDCPSPSPAHMSCTAPRQAMRLRRRPHRPFP